MYSNNNLNNFGDWELMRRLGAGGFGEVLHWRHRQTNQEIATKRLLDRVNLHADELAKLKERWLKEYNCMHEWQMEFIVRGITLSVEDSSFVQYLNQQHGDWRPLPVIIMEYCNGGDLRHVLRKQENCNGLIEYEIRAVLHAMRHAVDYLHTQCKIEHRDLKPDNIVMHIEGKRKIYKLTDFGFSTTLVDQTTKASIVGTTDYRAPEIVISAQYTKTVDYWSLGVLAFELICGICPFMPHQSLHQKINMIKNKNSDCIAITEDATQPTKFIYHTKLFAQKRVSSCFGDAMEQWLRMALDQNHRKRGSMRLENQAHASPPIFSALDTILHSKILTVFCINTVQFYAFDVSAVDMTMPQLVEAMAQTTQLPPKTFFIILPTGHPHGQLTPATRPINLYNEAWVDTSPHSDNPQAMLYLLSYQSDYNATSTAAHISPLLAQIMNNVVALPAWAIAQLQAHTYFMLSSEQRLLATLLMALNEYALTLEHNIFHFEPRIQELLEHLIMSVGRVRQFETMVQQTRLSCGGTFALGNGFVPLWDQKLAQFKKSIEKVQTIVAPSLKQRYNSAYRRIKELASSVYYKEISVQDTYKLHDFCTATANWQHNIENSKKPTAADIALITKICRDSFEHCLAERHKFLHSRRLHETHTTIDDVHEEFRKITRIVLDANSYLQQMQDELVQATAMHQTHLMESCLKTESLSQQMNALNMDGNSNTQLYQSVTSQTASLDQFYNLPPTELLLDESRQLMEMMCIDEVCSLPTTINMD